MTGFSQIEYGTGYGTEESATRKPLVYAPANTVETRVKAAVRKPVREPIGLEPIDPASSRPTSPLFV